MCALNMRLSNITNMNQCILLIQFENWANQIKKHKARFKSDLENASTSDLKNNDFKMMHIPGVWKVFSWKSKSDSEIQNIEPESNSLNVQVI